MKTKKTKKKNALIYNKSTFKNIVVIKYKYNIQFRNKMHKVWTCSLPPPSLSPHPGNSFFCNSLVRPAGGGKRKSTAPVRNTHTYIYTAVA